MRDAHTPSAVATHLAHYKREIRLAETSVQLNARIALFNMSETRLHLFQHEQEAITRLIDQCRQELTERESA